MFRDFTDIEILQRFQESLSTLLKNQEGETDHYFGMHSKPMTRLLADPDRNITPRDDPRIQVADSSTFQSCFATAEGMPSNLHPSTNADQIDALLWLSLRTLMHDAICSYFTDTRPYSPPSRFR